jgi:hypothetical protein
MVAGRWLYIQPKQQQLCATHQDSDIKVLFPRRLLLDSPLRPLLLFALNLPYYRLLATADALSDMVITNLLLLLLLHGPSVPPSAGYAAFYTLRPKAV